jgi:hypothetical protein
MSNQYFHNSFGLVTVVSENHVVVTYEDMFGRRTTLPTPSFHKFFKAVK